MFTCCSIPFSTKASLTEHLWSPYLHARGPIPCETCGASFRDMSGLAQHQLDGFHLVPPITMFNPFRCTVCEDYYTDVRILDNHMATTIHNIPCHWCQLICIGRFTWDQHLIDAHLDMLKQYPDTVYTAMLGSPVIGIASLIQCEHCDGEFSLEVSYEEHMSASHPESLQTPIVTPASPVHCNRCGREFFSQRALDEHTSAIHSGPFPSRRNDVSTSQPCTIPCTPCGELFPTQQTRDIHYFLNHPPLPPIHCPNCDRQFSTQHALNQHTSAVHAVASTDPRINPDVVLHPCRQCRALFYTQQFLDQHTHDTHTTRTPGFSKLVAPSTCSVCGKVFINEYALIQHTASVAHL